MATKSATTPTQVISEHRGRYLGELADRKRATTILDPNEVRGDYDAGRLLVTTMGGSGARVITQDDLRQFAHNAKRLGAKFKGGITAKAVIDMSLPDRRERAQGQIHYAIPLATKGGRMHLITNAGPDSKVTRHHVHIDFLDFNAAVASPSKLVTLARGMAAGPLRFDCDCEDHRYRFRYISTVGKFNAGRQEPGFPKITNPTLVGVACKHVLRVMRALGTTAILSKLGEMIERNRSDLEAKTHKATKAEIEALVKHQQRQKGRSSTVIETSTEKAARLGQQRALKSAASSKLAGAPLQKAPTPAAKKVAISAFERNLAKMTKLGVITPQQAANMLAQVQNAQ